MRVNFLSTAFLILCNSVTAQPTILFNPSEVTVSSELVDTGLTVDGATIYSGEVTIALVNPIANTVVVNIELDNSATVKEAIGQLKIKTVGTGPEFVSLGIFTKAGDPFSPLIGEVIRTGGSHGVNLTITRFQQVGLLSQNWAEIKCERINYIETEIGNYSNGDVLANVTGTGGGGTHTVSIGGYIGTLFIAGDLLGDLTVSTPGTTGNAAGRLVVEGQVGTPSNPVQIDLAGNLDELWGTDIYADVDLSTSTGVGDIGYLNCGGLGGDGNFTGSIKAGSVSGGTSGDVFYIKGEMDGEIELSGSILDASGSINYIGDILADSLVKVGDIPASAELTILDSSSLGGQIIVNQDLNGSFDWDGDVKIAGVPAIGPNETQPYKAPYYEALPSELGGGAIGLVPFNFHNKAGLLNDSGVSSDQFEAGDTATQINTNDEEIIIEHYGPVYATGTPLEIHKLVSGPIGTETSWENSGVDNDVTSSWDQSVSSTEDISERTVTISPVSDTWVAGWYRARPDTDSSGLKCAFVTGNPPPEYDSGHGSEALDEYFYFRVKLISFDLNMNTVVDAPDALIWISNPVDFNSDNTADAVDFQMLINNMD